MTSWRYYIISKEETFCYKCGVEIPSSRNNIRKLCCICKEESKKTGNIDKVKQKKAIRKYYLSHKKQIRERHKQYYKLKRELLELMRIGTF